MNVAAASSPPILPAADGSTTPAGQAGDAAAGAATGFDALLALVAGLAGPGEGEAAPGGPHGTAPGETTDEADAAPIDPTADPMLAVLAALMTPPPPAEKPVETTGAAAAVQALPVPAAAPDPSLVAAPPAPHPAATPVPAAEAPQAPAAEAFALDAVAAIKADPAPETAPAASPPTVPTAAPAPPTKAEAPTRAAEPTQPAAKAAAAAPADAVKTQTDQAVAALAPASDQGAASRSGSAPAPAVPEATAPTAAPAASLAAPAEPVRVAEATAPQVAPAPVRGSPETVAKLSADILKRFDGRSTRFELALDPAGLGRVDVKVEIGQHGHVTAALSFDNPQAAAELRSRAGELRNALQQAGFDLPDNALSFDVGSQAGGDGRGGQTAWDYEDRGHRGPAFAGRAFEAVLNGAESLGADLSLRLGAARADGVDIRI